MIEIELLTDDEETNIVCELYWEIDSDLGFVYKVAELAELANVKKTQVPSLVRENCNAYAPNWQCEDCGRPYVFSSRSDLLSKRRYLDSNSPNRYTFVCEECQRERREAELERRRRQEQAESRAREAAREKLRKEIRQAYDLSARPVIDIDHIAFHDIIYLTSILRGGAYENLTKIMPLAMFQQPLSPTKAFTTEIAESLFERGLIYIHPDSEPEAFPEGHARVFYTWRVYYAPPVFSINPDDPTGVLRELYAKINGPWPDKWYKETHEIWKKVALEECIEYLLFVLNEHHFEFSPGKKTRQYLEFALSSFSTAQVFNTIWRAAKDAAAYYQREDVSRRQAANSAIASIQRISERAIAEGWEIKPFGRNFQCPQSIISRVLYDTALKLGEDGFRLPPSLESVKLKDAPKDKKSSFPIYHSQDLVEKWAYDPDLVLGEYGADHPASEAQINFILALAAEFPQEANELEKVINAHTQDNPYSLSSCLKGQAKWMIGQLLDVQARTPQAQEDEQ
ncbi:hypothetical protein GF348_24365 [candidate division KSB3 bacterium]|nr:hypothetical protein [candidate division KSB3 bacterium]